MGNQKQQTKNHPYPATQQEVEIKMDAWNLKEQFLIKITAIAVIWAILITSFADWIATLPGVAQFIIGNGIFYLIGGLILGRYLDGGELLNKKVWGGMILTAALDILLPPLSVNLSGVISSTAMMSEAAIDTQLAHFWQLFGVQGPLLFILVYPVSFLLLNAIAAMLLSSKDLWSHLK